MYRSSYGASYDANATAQQQKRNLFEEEVEIDVSAT